jgi:dTDP-4-dehydrorhamnose reductase
VLITGWGGMLARAVNSALVAKNHSPASAVGFSARDPSTDITNPTAFRALAELLRPEWIFNLAAMTKVDECETNQTRAYAVNGIGAKIVAESAVAVDARVLQVSTDYVFPGKSERPYLEDDATGPLSVYGKSKLLGEQSVRDAAPESHVIVRTAWLYGAGGTNFVDTILRKARAGEPLRVVDDQRGSPTWTEDLALALIALMERDARGTFHCTNSGNCTWFDLAAAILEMSGARTSLERTNTESLARPAPRPRYSVLDCGKFERLTGTTVPDWRDALKRYLASGAAIPAATKGTAS